MWGISNLENPEYFRHGNAPVFVFLCDGYQTPGLVWLAKNWRAVHQNAGPDWHLVVPTIDPIGDSPSRATVENFNSTLAREMADIYGLGELSDPVLVLDDLDGTRDKLVISLPATDEELTAVFRDIGRIVSEIDASRSRAQIADDIYNKLLGRRVGRAIWQVLRSRLSALLSFALRQVH